MAPMDSFSEIRKNKVVFIIGATATGKTQLSVDLATQFPAEIINSDKIQVYKGLDIVTNKITTKEKQSVRHHLLGVVEDPDSDYTVDQFCKDATSAVEKIVNSDQVPIIVGGSNSFIQALVEDPVINFKSRFDCFFIWIDVSLPTLFSYISKRVDQMMDAGLVEEVRQIFDHEADYNRGIRRAIGVPELDGYFRTEEKMNDLNREILLASAIEEIKRNTHELARRQQEKIRRLKGERQWEIKRIDATEVFENRMKGKETEMEIAWDRLVLQPCLQKVIEFLCDYENVGAKPGREHN